MKPMKPASARALTWFAAGFVIIGSLILSPAGAFSAFLIATVMAAFPTIFGSGKIRIVAAILLLIAICFIAGKYPDFKSEQERYRERPHNNSTYERP